jgi:hypothetical protein
VVYILDEGGQQSLWTRVVATSSNVQIIPPAAVGYWALSFTPDSNYINFVKIEEGALASLYQMPRLVVFLRNCCLIWMAQSVIRLTESK